MNSKEYMETTLLWRNSRQCFSVSLYAIMVPAERTVNRMIRQTANLITGSRIAAALLLLFATPLTGAFYALYLWCGVSDMVDGTIARRTHSESRLGERLDSAAVALVMISIGVIQRRSRTPLGIMIWYHHRLCARYLRKK